MKIVERGATRAGATIRKIKGDLPPAADIRQKTVVGQILIGKTDGILVDAECGSQLDRGWQSVAGSNGTAKNGSCDLHLDLTVKRYAGFPIE